MAPPAEPLATAASPFPMPAFTAAPDSFTAGVSFTCVTVFATVAVYDVVLAEKAGLSVSAV